MDTARKTFALGEIDLEELYKKCAPFEECELRMNDPEYDAAFRKYMTGVAELGKQLSEEQFGELRKCIENAQECMSFEVMHFLRQGFLLGLSSQLGTLIRDIPPCKL